MIMEDIRKSLARQKQREVTPAAAGGDGNGKGRVTDASKKDDGGRTDGGKKLDNFTPTQARGSTGGSGGAGGDGNGNGRVTVASNEDNGGGTNGGKKRDNFTPTPARGSTGGSGGDHGDGAVDLSTNNVDRNRGKRNKKVVYFDDDEEEGGENYKTPGGNDGALKNVNYLGARNASAGRGADEAEDNNGMDVDGNGDEIEGGRDTYGGERPAEGGARSIFAFGRRADTSSLRAASRGVRGVDDFFFTADSGGRRGGPVAAGGVQR